MMGLDACSTGFFSPSRLLAPTAPLLSSGQQKFCHVLAAAVRAGSCRALHMSARSAGLRQPVAKPAGQRYDQLSAHCGAIWVCFARYTTLNISLLCLLLTKQKWCKQEPEPGRASGEACTPAHTLAADLWPWPAGPPHMSMKKVRDTLQCCCSAADVYALLSRCIARCLVKTMPP